MVTFIAATLSLFVGALLGYFLRSAEFRRDQRLKVYGEFMGAFLNVAHVGAGLYSVYPSLGDTIYNENADKVRDLWPQWREAAQAFEDATARLRLIASKDVRGSSEAIEDFIASNVRAVAPLMPGGSTEGWGAAAKAGPRKVEEEAAQLSREFADYASQDVTRWLAF